jgi:hypothetical protein
MVRRGRPTKSGERYKNGRLTRAARAAMQEDPMAVGIAARVRHYGISKDEAMAKLDPDDKDAKFKQRMCVNWGSALARLYKRDYIKKPQYVAGNTFAEHMRSYLLSKGIGAPTAPAFDPLRRGASLTEGTVKYEAEAREYLGALKEVDRVNPGRSATFLVMEICLRDGTEHLTPRDMGVFREGLNAIGRVIAKREQKAKKFAA